MAFSESIKDRNFIAGIAVGIVVIFGSTIPVVGEGIQAFFDFLSILTPFPEGIVESSLDSILVVLFVLLILRIIWRGKISPHVFKSFLLGFILVWTLFYLLAFIAISQFSFGF